MDLKGIKVGHNKQLDLSILKGCSTQLINLKNIKNNQCLISSIAAALYHKQIAKHNRELKRKNRGRGRAKNQEKKIDIEDAQNKVYTAFYDKLNLSSINFPCESRDIHQLLIQNPWLAVSKYA